MKENTFEVRRVIGENIRVKRKRLNLTQEEFAERANLSAQSLSALENGLQFARMDTYCKIADALDVSVFELFHALVASLDDQSEAILKRLFLNCDSNKQMALLNILRGMETLMQDTQADARVQ